MTANAPSDIPLYTLLLAEDELGVRTALAHSLPHHGFKVLSAENGRAAAELLERQHVDVLVTDLSMPVMNGYELLAHVKKCRENLPTVVMSALVADIDDKLNPFGALRVLMKPIPAKMLAKEARAAIAELKTSHAAGITLPNFLKLLQWEQRTCSVKVVAGKNKGRLHFLSGDLVNAYSFRGKVEGEAAVHDIFAWNNPNFELERSYHNQRRLVATPLEKLLITAHPSYRSQAVSAQLEATALEEAEDEEIAMQPRSPDPTVEPVTGVVRGSGIGAQPQRNNQHNPKETTVANIKNTLENLVADVEGAKAAAVVDYKSGMALGMVGSGLNLEVAAAGNTQVVRAKMKTMADLGLKGEIEDILITLEDQYHIIRPLAGHSLFMYLVLSREQANLAMARYKLASVSDVVTV